MPTYFVIAGVKIELYFKDHNPPHFHAIFAEYDAIIEIQTARVIGGALPPVKRKIILKWAKENKQVLLAIWDSLS